MPQALARLWFACGVFLTTLHWWSPMASGEAHNGWCYAIFAGVMGIGFFASAPLARLPWLRWVGITWWVGQLALFALRHRVEELPISAALTLLLLAGPGHVLMTRRARRAEA